MTTKILNTLIKTALKRKTPLGDNDALPNLYDNSYEYEIINKRFNEIGEELKKVENLESYDTDYLNKVLGEKLRQCQEKERPIRDELEKICGETVVKELGIPEGTMTITCELVDKIQPNYKLRITPNINNEDLVVNDINEMKEIKKEILKRRLINSLIQGGSYTLAKNDEFYLHRIYKLDKDLISLYDDIRRINDYLLFVTNIKIEENKTMQGSYVESILGRNGDLSSINSQGLIFPLLLQETIRGCLEIFSCHYIINKKNYKEIIQNSDYLQAEQWDLRLGVTLWNQISDIIDKTVYIPYYFASICNLELNDFNNTLKEVFANTKIGKEFKKNILYNAETQYKINKLTKNIEDDECTNEGYFSASEFNDFLLEIDNSENDDTELNELIEMSHNISYENISFEVGQSENDSFLPKLGKTEQYQLYPVINNKEFSSKYINFQAEPRIIGGEVVYQLHLFLDERLQHLNLGYNLIYAFIKEYGNFYCGIGRILNKDEIPHIMKHLSNQNDIKVSKVISQTSKKIIGYKFSLI